MKLDYANDPVLSGFLKLSKQDLYTYYKTHYANKHSMPAQPSTPQIPATSAGSHLHSPQKNFTACFHQKTTTSINKLDEYFKLPPEDFETCSPIHWWMGQQAQFLNLFWFACDLLCIPGAYMVYDVFFSTKLSSGSAVAVEHVFSGGRNTISLHHASLHPQMIKVLMLSKKKLHLLCAKVLHK